MSEKSLEKSLEEPPWGIQGRIYWGISGWAFNIFSRIISGGKCGWILDGNHMQMPGRMTAVIGVGILVDLPGKIA